MANIKQQIKRNLTNEKRRMINVSAKSSVKTAIKSVQEAVENKDLKKANECLKYAFKKLDTAHSKGIYHQNFVARHKSSLQQLVNTLQTKK